MILAALAPRCPSATIHGEMSSARPSSATNPRSTATATATAVSLRAIRFEDVSSILAVIERAVAHDCRAYYDAEQRRAVFLTYAQGLFVESLGPFESIVAVDADGETLMGFAQLDPGAARLRALFVDADFQRRGVGAALLAGIERRARRRGATRLCGAMSLNAVPFYARAGFRPAPGPERLVAAGVPVPVLRMDKDL